MKKVETPYINYEINNGILYAVFNPKIEITLDIAKKMVKTRLEFQEGKSYPTLMHFKFRRADKNVRAYMAKEGLQGLTAGAFLVDNTVMKIFFHFFLSFDKPSIPARFFTDEDEAEKWLEQYKTDAKQTTLKEYDKQYKH